VSIMQTMAQKGRREPWAAIEKITFSCSPQRAKLDETLALTVGFQVNGGIRRNFIRRLWEEAYDQHDRGFRLGYWVTIMKNRPVPVMAVRVKEDKFVRRGVFFWTRNPELPYRVWATIATEFETILYPKTETEAQAMLFDVTRSFEIPASKLGKGLHTLEGRIRAKWGKHIFTERGEAKATSSSLKVRIE